MQDKIIIRNGSVIDGTGAAPVATSVLIRDGKIAGLGAGAEAQAEGRPCRRVLGEDRDDAAG